MRRFTLLSLLSITLMAILTGCPPTTEVTGDRVARVAESVWLEPAPPGLLADTAWYALEPQDRVRTNSSGQARIQIEGCSSIYLFIDSGLQKSSCPKTGSGGTCTISGMSAHNNQCSAEVDTSTSTNTAIIRPTGTWYAVAYIPEELVTVVIVLDGAVEVLPVVDFAAGTLGAAIPVRAEQFLFTMPDPTRAIGGLPPRTPLPITDLPLIAAPLGIDIYWPQLEGQARTDGILPASWPPLGPAGSEQGDIAITFGGPGVGDPQAQDGYLLAVPWYDMAVEMTGDPDIVVQMTLGDGQVINAQEVAFDPDSARRVLAATDAPRTVTLLLPDSRPELQEIGKLYAEIFLDLDVQLELQIVPSSEIEAVFTTLLQAGEPVIMMQ